MADNTHSCPRNKANQEISYIIAGNIEGIKFLWISK